ncbi:NAD(P)-binding protein [Meredithblackwellia eburnea MCA 4105]
MGFSPPPSHFNVSDVPNLTGKVAIVTGGNAGIGKGTCRGLLAKGCTVYMASRSKEKAELAIEELKTETGVNTIEFLKLDLNDLRTIPQTASDFLARENRLDILVNNAGIMFPEQGSATVQGIEQQFGVMVLGHHALTKALLPILVKTAEISDTKTVRVVTVTGAGHLLANKDAINFKVLENPNLWKAYDSHMQAKLGNIIFSNELARRYADKGVLAVSVHPGLIRSQLRDGHTGLLNWVSNKFLEFPEEFGPLTSLFAASSPELTIEKDSGGYFVPWCRKYHPGHKQALNEALAKEMWEWCEKQESKVGIPSNA